MLVLTRKLNEAIQAGEVRFTIVAVGKDRVRVGIDAPPHVNVVRTELLGEQSKVQGPRSKVAELAA